MPSKSQKIQHLYNRAGFGLSPNQLQKKEKSKLKKELKQVMEKSIAEVPLTVIPENPAVRLMADSKSRGGDRKTLAKALSKAVQEGRVKLRDLNLRWMEQLTRPDTMVREKLALFWHDHFGVRANNSYYAQLHNNLLRKHALGKYKDLLLAVAKDPAMLQFLNNQQNNKRKPNENFARELLELYTIGIGNYTETDIKEGARAFTGWKFDRFTSEFRFVQRQHDEGVKEFMGHSGNFNGEDIIDIILANKQTARYLSAKLFQYYVSDQPDEALIEILTDRLYQSEYDMGDLIGYIFKADWFYEQRFLNSKIKSPQELLHGIRLHFGLKYGEPEALLYLQRSLGQQLFFPPGVNGWSVGREWINSSSLVNRMRLVSSLAKNTGLGIRVKEDLDAQKGSVRGLAKLLSTGQMDWYGLEDHLKGMTQEEQLDKMAGLLINHPLGRDTREVLLKEMKKQKTGESIKWLAVNIASLPQYQLA